MPVIIEDSKTTLSTTTTDVYIPSGRHDSLLLNFATAYNWTATPPSRSAPSGGGGSWTAAGSRTISFSVLGGEGMRYISMCVYAWRSIPTSRGDVTITIGGASGETGQRDHFYSLSNAQYHAFEQVGPGDYTEMGDDMAIDVQGSAHFGGAISALKDSFIIGITPLYDTIVDSQGGNSHPDISTSEYNLFSHNRHRSNVGPGGRFVRNHIRWDASTPVTTAGVYIGVKTVECSH